MTTPPISIPAQTLRTMLKAVLPHAGTDDTLPALMAVRFEVRAGVLYLTATDRYTMGVARERIAGAVAAGLPDQSALVAHEHAEHMIETLSDATGTAAIIIKPGEMLVDTDGDVFAWATGGDFYPDWRSKIGGFLAGETGELGDRFGVDPKLLARFVLDEAPWDPWEPKPLSLRVVPQNEAPVIVVTYGTWFLGAITATRRTDMDGLPRRGTDGPQWADWTAALAEHEAATDAAPAELVKEGTPR